MKTHLAVLIPFLFLVQASAGTELPSFLVQYYSPALDVGSKKLTLINQTKTDNRNRAIYSTEDDSLALSIESIECDKPKCDAIFENILYNLNTEITNNSGLFIEITESEVNAKVVRDDMIQQIFVYILPSSVQIWAYSTLETQSGLISPKFEMIRGFTNRSRYAEAISAGNVSMGHWGEQIYDYATQLFEQGNKTEALKVLKHILATSPFNYEAHMTFIKNTSDTDQAKNSASIVFKNAEDGGLIEQAAKYMGKDISDINSLPLLRRKEKDLQLILIPLSPCNPWLLEEAATTFQHITAVPVKIRRLKEDWAWASEDRITNQRMIQGLLIKLKRVNIHFKDWTKDRYIKEMLIAVEKEDALSRYRMNELIKKVAEQPGQYLIDSYLNRFCDILAAYRSTDERTMYVGITEANIYSGDNNYVFSQGVISGNSKASILSYYMMMGKTLGEEYESRQRLTERIAKELIPASLKQLGIPRSTDPTCPYSYSSGVSRLDQKTLKLSEQVKKALGKFRNQ